MSTPLKQRKMRGLGILLGATVLGGCLPANARLVATWCVYGESKGARSLKSVPSEIGGTVEFSSNGRFRAYSPLPFEAAMVFIGAGHYIVDRAGQLVLTPDGEGPISFRYKTYPHTLLLTENRKPWPRQLFMQDCRPPTLVAVPPRYRADFIKSTAATVLSHLTEQQREVLLTLPRTQTYLAMCSIERIISDRTDREFVRACRCDSHFSARMVLVKEVIHLVRKSTDAAITGRIDEAHDLLQAVQVDRTALVHKPIDDTLRLLDALIAKAISTRRNRTLVGYRAIIHPDIKADCSRKREPWLPDTDLRNKFPLSEVLQGLSWRCRAPLYIKAHGFEIGPPRIPVYLYGRGG